MTFDRISFRYEVLDAQVELQHFLRSYNFFIFETPVESSKFQIKALGEGGTVHWP